MDQHRGSMVSHLAQVQQPRVPRWSVPGSEITLKWSSKPFLCWCATISQLPIWWTPEVTPTASYMCGEERNKLHAHRSVYLTWLGNGKSKQVFPVSATVFGLITWEFYFLYMCWSSHILQILKNSSESKLKKPTKQTCLKSSYRRVSPWKTLSKSFERLSLCILLLSSFRVYLISFG